MNLRGVLLDVDGTLIHSNDAHAAAWKRALHEQRITVVHEQMRRRVGMGAEQLLPLLGLSAVEEPGKRAAVRQGEIFRTEMVGSLRPTRGARALVERFRALGLMRVTATSADPLSLHLPLKAARVDDLIQIQASSGDADRSKRSRTSSRPR